MHKLTDFIVEYKNVLDKELCQQIINTFEEDDRKKRGVTSGEYLGVDNSEYKKSTDLNISYLAEEGWGEVDSKLYEKLGGYMKEYLGHIQNLGINYGQMVNVIDSGYNIQRTEVGEYYKWHNDFAVKLTNDPNIVKCRDFSYIFYLNDDFEGGGTQFFNEDGHIITPETGKLMIFPSTPLWAHQGMEVTKGSKYIIVGWIMSDKFLIRN